MPSFFSGPRLSPKVFLSLRYKTPLGSVSSAPFISCSDATWVTAQDRRRRCSSATPSVAARIMASSSAMSRGKGDDDDDDARATSSSPPPPAWRHVATAFVSLSPAQGGSPPLYALVKRSDAVSTYRGKWGAVSGGIERGIETGRRRRRGGAGTPDESPEARAATEVEEEIGIDRRHLVVSCRGRPLSVDDAGARDGGERERFVVHPVRFRFDRGAPSRSELPPVPLLRVNWESSEAAWVSQGEIEDREAKGETVPRLTESLRRTFPPPTTPSPSSPSSDAVVSASVTDLVDDRTRGASQLAAVALSALGEAASLARAEAEAGAGAGAAGRGATEGGSADPAAAEVAWELCADWGFALAASRPSMAPLTNSVASALVRARERWDDEAAATTPATNATAASPAEVFSAVALAAEEERRRLEEASRKLVLGGVEALKAALSRWRRQRELHDGRGSGGGGRGARPAVVPRIVTISFSSVVRDALVGLIRELSVPSERGEDRELTIAVCEGRPLCEGARLAETLAAAVAEASSSSSSSPSSSSSSPSSPSPAKAPKIKIELCTDAAGPALVRQRGGETSTAAVVVGADAVFPEKDTPSLFSGVVNKVGSRALAEAAAELRVPAFALAGRCKVSGASAADVVTLSTGGACFPRSHEECSGDELLLESKVARNESISLRNVYFESVPLRLFDESGGGVLVEREEEGAGGGEEGAGGEEEGAGGEEECAGGPASPSSTGAAVALSASEVDDLAKRAEERAIAAFRMDWL